MGFRCSIEALIIITLFRTQFKMWANIVKKSIRQEYKMKTEIKELRDNLRRDLQQKNCFGRCKKLMFFVDYFAVREKYLRAIDDNKISKLTSYQLQLMQENQGERHDIMTKLLYQQLDAECRARYARQHWMLEQEYRCLLLASIK